MPNLSKHRSVAHAVILALSERFVPDEQKETQSRQFSLRRLASLESEVLDKV